MEFSGLNNYSTEDINKLDPTIHNNLDNIYNTIMNSKII